jgi:signal transduction histidine kinase
MTLTTFWKIFLKIFALYLIWQILVFVPSLISTITYSNGQDSKSIFYIVTFFVFIGLFFYFIIDYCLFQTDKVINKLRLTKGFTDEKLEINIHRSSLLTIAVIVLGGLMLANSLPSLISNMLFYVERNDASTKFRDNPATRYVIVDFLKVVIGYFMLADSRLIVNFIERKRKKSVVTVEEDVNE